MNYEFIHLIEEFLRSCIFNCFVYFSFFCGGRGLVYILRDLFGQSVKSGQYAIGFPWSELQ